MSKMHLRYRDATACGKYIPDYADYLIVDENPAKTTCLVCRKMMSKYPTRYGLTITEMIQIRQGWDRHERR